MMVLSVGYPLFPLCADAAGGAEQILFLLDRELCAREYQSIIVAPAGSTTHGRLLATPAANGEITGKIRSDAEAVYAKVIREALLRLPVDLIHFHGLDFHSYIPETDVPMLATLHLPFAWYPEWIFRQSRVHLNCVSQSQAGKTGLSVVSNGVDTARYVPASSKGDHFLWLGRVCPEKGVHLALQAAKAADVPLLIAGPVHPFASHEQYFRDRVEPLLDEKRLYIGAVAGVNKLQLLARAKALLVTSTVSETSSLVAMEAASSGTPVIALRSGALPEVVEHGRTGFVVGAIDELPIYIGRADEISSTQCRQVALQRFSARRMAEGYLALYKRILGMVLAPQDSLYAS